MQINSISAQYVTNNYFLNNKPYEKKAVSAPPPNNLISYLDCVNFTATNTRRIENIDHNKYKNLSPTQKQILRKKCVEFDKMLKSLPPKNIKKPEQRYLPLMDDNIMKEYIKVCNVYNTLKGEPIICLGRSPKWFLNTASWMKDGIDNYKFVAFSKSWYRSDGSKMSSAFLPTDSEKDAYKKYLKSIQVDPKHIVKIHEKTGKKVIITDYITSGKGACSFLDIMSEYAEEQGVLDKLANSIRLVTIGCMEFQEEQDKYAEYIPTPRVPLPDRLLPYYRTIPQEFHDIPYEVHKEMLINDDTNECRSSYYPHTAWNVYNPSKYKTGKISDKKIAELKEKCPRSVTNFDPIMKDYRNLLNFRILDYLEQNNLLKENLTYKKWGVNQ